RRARGRRARVPSSRPLPRELARHAVELGGDLPLRGPDLLDALVGHLALEPRYALPGGKGDDVRERRSPTDRLLGPAVEFQYRLEDEHLLLGRAVLVDLVEGALLEEAVLDHLRGDEHQALILGQGVGPYQPDDLLEALLALHKVEGAGAEAPPFGVLAVPPLAQLLGVLGVRVDPRDGRIVPRVREVAVQGPEAAREALRMLGDRLREVAAGRGDRAYDGDGAAPSA